MATFTFVPSRGFSRQSKPRVTSLQFGDGYSQRIPEGINTLNETWSLTWASVAIATAQQIVQFLADHKGATSFDWTPPGDVESMKVICPDWSSTYDSHISRTVTATFVRVYEP